MYKKSVGLLASVSFVFMACLLCVRGVDMAGLCTKPAQELKLELEQVEEKDAARSAVAGEAGLRETALKVASGPTVGRKEMGIADVAVSGQRIVDFSVMDQRYIYHLTEEELEVLCRIVEAEAGNEDGDGKLLVANVVLNRVNSEKFPDTVTEVVFQREGGVSQFSPVYNGSYYTVTVSDETVGAVERALMGEDISQGALYFAARKYADSTKMRWFDTKLTYLFLYGGHEFFK